MKELQDKAAELLRQGTVRVVLGYARGPAGRVRPAFVEKPEDAGRLVYDDRCRLNLAVYLSKPEVKKKGKPALVAPLGTLRAVLQLASESQVRDGEVVLLGIAPDGRLLDLPDLAAAEAFVNAADLSAGAADRERMAELEKRPAPERLRFWQEELSRCIKCFACRAACPMCYCDRCLVECNQPQWIPVPSHALGNWEWHVNRAMHLAGRCVGCGACAEACPLGLPLDLLTRRTSETILREFGSRAGTRAKGEYALSTFKPGDKEDFIR